ncbi:MAG: PAS domain S-box protein [Nitrospirae bacterium]|nr:MAG: PAS domain S-box protein [Nitrospirota bacterium]
MPGVTFLQRLRGSFQTPEGQLTLGLCGLIVLLLGTYGAVLIVEQQQELREDAERHGLELARGLSLIGATAVLDNLFVVQEALTSRAGRDPDILSVLVVDRDQMVIASDNPMQIGEVLADPAIQRAGAGGKEFVLDQRDAQGRDVLVVFEPLRSDGKLLGWIRVDLSLERAWREAYRTLWKQLLAVAFLLAISLYVFLKMVRRLRSALHTSEEKYRHFWETSTDAVVFMDMDRRIQFANPAVKDVFGYDPEEVIGRDIAVLQPQRLREAHREGLARYLRTGVKKLDWRATEVVGLRKDGTEVPIEIAFSDMEMEGRRWFVGFMRDITERKRAEEALHQSEEQLRQSQKMEAIGKLAGGVAHDFNNLLTAITGYSDLLLGHAQLDGQARKNAEEIRKAAFRAASLTHQLLAFSRRQMLTSKVLNLNAVIMDLEPMLRRLIGEDIELTIVPGPALGQVQADPSQIEQIILNLVINARDAMPRGGKLTIETANVELDEEYAGRHAAFQPGSYVLVAVSDTGMGMDEETAARVFEPFFTTKEPGKGTGLGLSTVYGIVKQSDGYIWVYSEPGLGTTFKFYLPRSTSLSDKVQADVERTQIPQGTETILLAEDEDVVRTLVGSILQDGGYTVLAASHSEEAFRISGRHDGTIDLMVTDVVMPGMSGRELAERLASLRPQMKVLYISGYTDDAIVRHGVQAEGTAFLQKPFTPDVLLRKVREVLETPVKGRVA